MTLIHYPVFTFISGRHSEQWVELLILGVKFSCSLVRERWEIQSDNYGMKPFLEDINDQSGPWVETAPAFGVRQEWRLYEGLSSQGSEATHLAWVISRRGSSGFFCPKIQPRYRRWFPQSPRRLGRSGLPRLTRRFPPDAILTTMVGRYM